MINPIFQWESVQAAIPLFFDHIEKRLAYCHRDGRARLYCRSTTAEGASNQMNLSSAAPSITSLGWTGDEKRRRLRILENGSWKEMYLSQPSCPIRWRVELSLLIERQKRGMYGSHSAHQENYCGTVWGVREMDSSLDGLAASSVAPPQSCASATVH